MTMTNQARYKAWNYKLRDKPALMRMSGEPCTISGARNALEMHFHADRIERIEPAGVSVGTLSEGADVEHKKKRRRGSVCDSEGAKSDERQNNRNRGKK